MLRTFTVDKIRPRAPSRVPGGYPAFLQPWFSRRLMAFLHLFCVRCSVPVLPLACPVRPKRSQPLLDHGARADTKDSQHKTCQNTQLANDPHHTDPVNEKLRCPAAARWFLEPSSHLTSGESGQPQGGHYTTILSHDVTLIPHECQQ